MYVQMQQARRNQCNSARVFLKLSLTVRSKTMRVINFTQHALTKAQLDDIVQRGGEFIDPQGECLAYPDLGADVRDLLTFTRIPYQEDVEFKAGRLAGIAASFDMTHAIIGGAPYLMGALENALKSWGIQPMYAFTQREAVEVVNADGSTTKTSVFKHAGWYEA